MGTDGARVTSSIGSEGARAMSSIGTEGTIAINYMATGGQDQPALGGGRAWQMG